MQLTGVELVVVLFMFSVGCATAVVIVGMLIQCVDRNVPRVFPSRDPDNVHRIGERR